MNEDFKAKLLFPRRNASAVLGNEETAVADEYCKGYIDFLNAAKTEREAIRWAVTQAEARGFVPWTRGIQFTPGSRVYLNQRGKAMVLCVAGKRPLSEGISVLAAHVDSPRLDLKMLPLYEEAGAAYFDTHYYGGVKPYQWTGIPLSLHGYVVRKDGKTVDIRIGDTPGDPALFIADLLPHLAREQMKRPGKDVVKTEDLDVIAGLRACPDESGGGAIKLNILRLLHAQYGITEGDLVSAELSVVPAFPAGDLGLDRSMVGGYGQDDKVCAYPALTALFSLTESLSSETAPEYTSCVVLADKEETGSLGMTGMDSVFFSNFIEDLGGEQKRIILHNSLCLSADVNTCFYPLYADVFDPHGDASLNCGVVLYRYWGNGGKDNTNDAQAETAAALRKILDEAGILWQTGEGGRVDAEESGTLSRYFAGLDIPSIDLGVPLLSMHSPYEAASKTDIHMAYRTFTAFFRRNAGV